MLNFNISYPNLIKFPYFAGSIKREDRGRKQRRWGGEIEADFTNNSII
jgi:hypothetical protein